MLPLDVCTVIIIRLACLEHHRRLGNEECPVDCTAPDTLVLRPRRAAGTSNGWDGRTKHLLSHPPPPHPSTRPCKHTLTAHPSYIVGWDHVLPSCCQAV